jgi:hypothetical protein
MWTPTYTAAGNEASGSREPKSPSDSSGPPSPPFHASGSDRPAAPVHGPKGTRATVAYSGPFDPQPQFMEARLKDRPDRLPVPSGHSPARPGDARCQQRDTEFPETSEGTERAILVGGCGRFPSLERSRRRSHSACSSIPIWTPSCTAAGNEPSAGREPKRSSDPSHPSVPSVSTLERSPQESARARPLSSWRDRRAPGPGPRTRAPSAPGPGARGRRGSV